MYRYQGIAKTYEKFKRHFDFLEAKVAIIIVIKDYKVYVKTKTLQYKLYVKTKTLQYKLYRKFQILFIFEQV